MFLSEQTTYAIISHASLKVLAVNEASKDNGAAIIENAWRGNSSNSNQLFRFEPIPAQSKNSTNEQVYIIRNEHSNKVLDIKGGSCANNADIIQRSYYVDNQDFSKQSQLWNIILNKDNQTVSICSAMDTTGRYCIKSGNIVRLAQYNKDDLSMQFRIINTKLPLNQSVIIKSSHSNMAIELSKNRLIESPVNIKNKHQQWKIIPLTNDTKKDGKRFYTIENVATGLVFDIPGQSKTNNVKYTYRARICVRMSQKRFCLF